MSRQIEAMRKLGMTEEEIQEVLKTDREIDRGADPFPLTQEQEQVVKKARQADRAVNAYGKEVKRERKVDDDKRYLMRAIKSGLFTYAGIKDETAINVINAEREIEFIFNGKKYKIVLSAPRK